MLNKVKTTFGDRQLIGYGIIGCSGIIIDLAAYTSLVFVGLNPIIATLISSCLGIINNFLWNAYKNFKKTDQLFKRFLKFYGIGLSGLIVSAALIYLLHGVIGLDPIWSKVITIVPIVLIQYLLNRKFSFASTDSPANDTTNNSIKSTKQSAASTALSQKNPPLIVPALFALVLAFIAVLSILFTVQSWDSLALNTELQPITILLVCLGAIILLALLTIVAKYISLSTQQCKIVIATVMGITALAGTLYILAFNGLLNYYADSSNIINSVTAGPSNPNYGYFNTYTQGYPSQVGTAFLVRAVFAIFGENNLLPFYFINLLAICAIQYLIYKIADSIFEHRKVTFFTSLLLLMFIPLFLYLPQVYGDISGVAFALSGLYCLICYIKQKKWKYIGLMTITFTAALFMKVALIIVPFATVLFGIVYLIKTRKPKLFAATLVACIIALLVQSVCVRAYNDSFTGSPNTQSSIRLIKWIAMGLQNGTLASANEDAQAIETYTQTVDFSNKTELRQPGMYNSWVEFFYVEDSIQAIKQSLRTLATHPLYALEFFTYKAQYMWTGADFETRTYDFPNDSTKSISYFTWQNSDMPDVINALERPDSPIHKGLLLYMDIFQSLVYILAFISVFLALLRRKIEQIDAPELLIATVFLSSFGFYFIWEVLPRYALLYFLLLIPLAAKGITSLNSIRLSRSQAKFTAKI